jgi:hypothetical protein
MGFATSFGTGFFSGLADTIDKQQASKLKRAEYKEGLEEKYKKDKLLADASNNAKIRAAEILAGAKKKAKIKYFAGMTNEYGEDVAMPENISALVDTFKGEEANPERVVAAYNAAINQGMFKTITEKEKVWAAIGPNLLKYISNKDQKDIFEILPMKYSGFSKDNFYKDRIAQSLYDKKVLFTKNMLRPLNIKPGYISTTLGLSRDKKLLYTMLLRKHPGDIITAGLEDKPGDQGPRTPDELISYFTQVDNMAVLNDGSEYVAPSHFRFGKKPSANPSLVRQALDNYNLSKNGAGDALKLAVMIESGLTDPHKYVFSGGLTSAFVRVAKRLWSDLSELSGDRQVVENRLVAALNSVGGGSRMTNSGLQLGDHLKKSDNFNNIVKKIMQDPTQGLIEYLSVGIAYAKAKSDDPAGRISEPDFERTYQSLFSEKRLTPQIMRDIAQELKTNQLFYGLVAEDIAPTVAASIARQYSPGKGYDFNEGVYNKLGVGGGGRPPFDRGGG